MAHGMVLKSMVHSSQDLGLPIKVDQADDLFELIKGVEFGFCEGFDIAASHLSEGQQGIAVLEVSGLRFGRQ